MPIALNDEGIPLVVQRITVLNPWTLEVRLCNDRVYTLASEMVPDYLGRKFKFVDLLRGVAEFQHELCEALEGWGVEILRTESRTSLMYGVPIELPQPQFSNFLPKTRCFS